MSELELAEAEEDPGNVEKAGVIGLGIIGSRVADRLRESGRHVYVWSRTPKPVPNFVSSPAEVARLATCVQIFVSTGEALLEVVKGLEEALTENHVVLNHSTVDPESVVEAYRIVKAAGASFLDAPFTGSKDAAANGALVYYIGGDLSVLERVRPLLEVSAREVLVVGKVGEATVVKIATNMISAATVEILAEAYGLVTAAGVEGESFRKALELNACSSTLTGMKLPSIMERDYETHFSLKHMFKDARYALGLAKELGLELPALSTTANLMYRSIQKGNGDRDYSVLAEKYQPGSGNGTEG